ncbi:ABC transporter ATP-binding protein [Rhodobacter sp. NSM]|uniref:ABC transporter ATP-binding protein n=1 Tax=Rhodobacter sp. NSM TaxID=3457501 RepID=UPI003FD1CD25
MLAARSLSVGYGTRRVIEDLDLELPGGRMVSILGPNGCGKSTLLRALGRLLPPARGTVALDGQDLRRYGARALARRLAILPQSPLAPEGILVGDLVRRGRLPWRGVLSPWRAADQAACEAALQAVRLDDLADRPLDELSGGQRQRAWIALVLAQSTPLLLLDEPTTFLDLVHQIEVLSLLRHRNLETGLTVVSVLHDLNLAGRFSDLVVLLGPRGIVAIGPPREVLTAPNLRAAFALEADIHRDPRTGTPLVIPH